MIAAAPALAAPDLGCDPDAPVLCRHRDQATAWIMEYGPGQRRLCVDCLTVLADVAREAAAGRFVEAAVRRRLRPVGLEPAVERELLADLLDMADSAGRSKPGRED